MADVTLVHVSLAQPRPLPIGMLSIAAVLQKAGYVVDIRDVSIPAPKVANSIQLVSQLDFSAPVIGFSCLSDTLPLVLRTVQCLKRKFPDKVVILGGAGPTGVAQAVINNFPAVDVIVRGEGELTIVELMECLTTGGQDDLQHVAGICFRMEGEAYSTKPRPRIQDLDGLPLPSYDQVDMTNYPLVNVVFSRGCPYHCTFCDVAPMWQRKHYRRSVNSVINELKLLRRHYGKTHVEFTDETFVLQSESVLALCEQLRKEDLGIKWTCSGRVNLITEELLSEMAGGGCKALFYGIESGSDHVLDTIRKKISVSQAVDQLRLTLKYMGAVASFIWGFPFESLTDFQKTLFFMVYLSQIGVDTRLNRLTPFALAPLYETDGEDLFWLDQGFSFSLLDPFQTLDNHHELRDLVRTYPTVFPEFYWFPTQDLDQKIGLVESLHRHWHRDMWISSTGSSASESAVKKKYTIMRLEE